MLVVHAAFLDDSLALWAEPLPGGEALLQVLHDIDPELKFRKHLAQTATAWLPTHKGRAVPSTPLLGEIAPAEQCALAPHACEALVLPAPEAILLLTVSAGKHMLAPS